MNRSYVNDIKLCADTDRSTTGGGTMPKSEHTYYLKTAVPNDDDWRVFTQLMYNRIDTLASSPVEVIV